jgi:hypothetical protein
VCQIFLTFFREQVENMASLVKERWVEAYTKLENSTTAHLASVSNPLDASTSHCLVGRLVCWCVMLGSFETSEALLGSLNVSHFAQQSLLKALQGTLVDVTC